MVGTCEVELAVGVVGDVSSDGASMAGVVVDVTTDGASMVGVVVDVTTEGELAVGVCADVAFGVREGPLGLHPFLAVVVMVTVEDVVIVVVASSPVMDATDSMVVSVMLDPTGLIAVTGASVATVEASAADVGISVAYVDASAA